MKIGNHKHRVERRSHVRISAARSPLSDPLSTNHDSLTTIHHPRATSHASRRGVLLLLILALLAMFGLIAVAFVVLTGQAQRSAKSIERIDLAMDPPKNLLQQAAMQVFRGTNNPSSVLGAHSLLEDMYGTNWYACQITNTPTPVCGGQIIEFSYKVSSNGSWTPDKETPAGSWVADSDWQKRMGCVATIYNGSVAGVSARIVGYNSSTSCLQILAGGNLTATSLGSTANAKFLINGAPFSGTGFGYTTGGFDSALALQPNNASNRNPLGGANEDYDAADYQNMLLAAQAYDSTNNRMMTIPSLHRPALVRSVGSVNANIVLRPLDTAFVNSTSYFKADWDGNDKSLGRGQRRRWCARQCLG